MLPPIDDPKPPARFRVAIVRRNAPAARNIGRNGSWSRLEFPHDFSWRWRQLKAVQRAQPSIRLM
ncbi:hypothetical protein ASD02_06175 [Ensifer sp. Root1252]|jgi:hypothetical protein|nr:hypothetical protein ASD00_23140 [Ensifer sp. Root31]KQW58579.1 hypothetical protein ASD02_06175 [Ensifer sp. Root1252]KQW74282.1 hypothetical protein ASD03_06810 [Ensifer sp. Root127]KQY78554.1 hypothetical protein ASD52_01475 [Ensifer sp. Root142]KRC98490.1 hypothetical protein ASE47_04825 [Ensifer sp. Root258]OMQ39980.1 hypothetical protein BKP54_29880 [Ensifer sp. 1H6]PSS65479.1 hypothetical protein C6558_08840 [Ensifer sp. NM-2]